MVDVLKRIDELKEERGWSEYQLAEQSGITQSTISSWYRHNTVPKVLTIEKLCIAFGISMSEFFAEGDTVYDLTDVQQLLLKYAAKLTPDQLDHLIELLKSI